MNKELEVKTGLGNPSMERMVVVPKAISSLEKLAVYSLFLAFALPLSSSLNLGQFWFRIYLFDLPLCVLLFLCFLRLYVQRMAVYVTKVDGLFMIFLVWLFITTYAGLDPYYSLHGTLLWLRTFILFLCLRNVRMRAGDLMQIVVLLLCIQVPLAFLQFSTQSSLGAVNQYFGITGPVATTWRFKNMVFQRVQGTFPSPNILTTWLVLLLPFMLTSMSISNIKGMMRGLVLLLWFSGLVVLVFTGSRAGIAAWLVGFILVFMIGKRSFVRILGILLFWLCLVVCMFVFSDKQSSLGVLSILQRFTILEDPKRVALIRVAFQIISSRPLLGVGYGNFILGMDQYSFPFRIKSRAGVHNIPLKITAETGIIGGVLFVLILIALLRRQLRDLKYASPEVKPLALAMFTSTVSFVLTMQFYTIMDHHSVLPFFFALAGAVQGAVRRREVRP